MIDEEEGIRMEFDKKEEDIERDERMELYDLKEEENDRNLISGNELKDENLVSLEKNDIKGLKNGNDSSKLKYEM
jgi:hypothetical protein